MSNCIQVSGSGVSGGLSSVDQLLTAALGVRGQVIKTRTLYIAGQTRIHIDQVQGLGDFLELEVRAHYASPYFM